MTSTASFLIALLAVFALLAGCSEVEHAAEASAMPSGTPMKVYKSPDCGCCNDWIEHVRSHGFRTEAVHPYNVDETKLLLGVAARYHSCHTAQTDEGYVFEGHVPARYIKQFLADKPKDAIGLAVPGMPKGSPGMEAGGEFEPYQVLLLKADGSSEVYADVRKQLTQY